MGKDSGERVMRKISLVGVGYMPSKEGEDTNEVFCKKLGEVSCLLALVPIGDLNKQKQISADI